ncbi:hypothetical protein LXL04_017495 [Taraxacum kok-saghyz]
MPEKSHRDTGKALQSIEAHQSAWFTHWTGTRFESSTHDPSPHLTRNEEDDHDIKKHRNKVETASDNFGSSKDLELAMSLKKPDTPSFPFFKRGQESAVRNLIPNEELQALGPQFSHKKPSTDLNIGSSSKECHFQTEEVSQVPSEQVKYHMFFGETHTTTHLPKTKSVAMEQEHKMPSFFRQDNVTLLKNNHPSTSTNSLPSLIEEQYKRMQKHIGMGFFPHQTGCPEMIKPGTVQSFHNGLHSFSRTTHSLLITKQTDVKLYQEKQIFRESMVSTQLKQEAHREVNRSPPYFAHSQRGVKLQLLDSSDQESQDKIENVQKNESSADTDTMDMESFKENHLSGLHFSPRKKETTMESNIPILPFSKPKDARGKRKIELPDINVEISSLPVSSSSTEKPDPCTSRTQSLDMNTLNFNLDHTTNSNSNECSNTPNHGSHPQPEPQPGNRWIKRLKLTTPDPCNNKQGNNKKPPENGTTNKYFTKIKNDKAGHPLEIEVGKSDDNTNNINDNDNTNKEPITLSHSWIQRWSCGGNQGQKGPVVEKFKEGNCKVEEYEKKQFPSIAAMALMGKAMSGFQQCKFEKKESFVIWNTKGFEQ